MKLAEALILRADVQKRVQDLRGRLIWSVRIQEGDAPPENPAELLGELDRLFEQFEDLVRRINRTNAQTEVAPGVSITDLLAQRDRLALERSTLAAAIQAAVGGSIHDMGYRVTRSEIKFVRTINVAELQRRVDDLARRYRELDSRIQALNWSVDLL